MHAMQTNEQHNVTTPNVSLEGMTLHVADVERSLEFYTRIPGARVKVHRLGSFALLSIGNGRLSLLKEGPTHLEFDTSDPDKLYQQFKAAGLPVEEPPTLKTWGEYDFTLHDPDGHCLEFDSSRHQQYASSHQPGQDEG
jgi:catechol 2,3-dioxygenase-like lactoylglutathione lyase family enzyme